MVHVSAYLNWYWTVLPSYHSNYFIISPFLINWSASISANKFTFVMSIFTCYESWNRGSEVWYVNFKIDINAKVLYTLLYSGSIKLYLCLISLQFFSYQFFFLELPLMKRSDCCKATFGEWQESSASTPSVILGKIFWFAFTWSIENNKVSNGRIPSSPYIKYKKNCAKKLLILNNNMITEYITKNIKNYL